MLDKILEKNENFEKQIFDALGLAEVKVPTDYISYLCGNDMLKWDYVANLPADDNGYLPWDIFGKNFKMSLHDLYNLMKFLENFDDRE